MRPKIGITLDWQQQGTFSTRPHYALRQQYFDIVDKAGGLPIGIPYLAGSAEKYLQLIDGLIVPGGFFESPREWYLSDSDSSPYAPSPRLQFDLDIIQGALKVDMPMLGICAGMQLMCGMLGCKMTNDINEYADTTIDHLDEKPAEEKAHKVVVNQETLLAAIVECEEFYVNTAHKEAVVQVADRVVVNAVSEDQIIEGIEITGQRFAVGVQWHPEFFMDPEDASFKIIAALIKEASKNAPI